MTPPGGGGDIEYYTGSYLWQAAVVEFLKSRPTTEGHTLVIGDDVLLRRGFDWTRMLGGEADATSALSYQIDKVEGPLSHFWFWKRRLALTWTSPTDAIIGNGVDDCGEILRESTLFRRNAQEIKRVSPSVLHMDREFEASQGWVGQSLVSAVPSVDAFDFELPLFFGYSDVFSFPNSDAAAVQDFLARTVRANVFVEIAIPTMLAWSGWQLVDITDKMEILWGQERERLQFRSWAAIAEYFDLNPEIVAAHPVKFSGIRE